MSLLKKSYLKEIRAKLVEKFGSDIPDEAWNKVVKKVENDLKKELYSSQTQKEIAKAFYIPMFEMAEKGDVILEIDGVNIGKKLKEMRKQKKFEDYNELFEKKTDRTDG